MSATSVSIDSNLRKARAKVTNRRAVLPGIDARSAPARRYRDLYHDLLEQLGGADRVTAAEDTLLRRAAALSMRCEELEALHVSSKRELEISEHAAASNALARILTRVGCIRPRSRREREQARTSPPGEWIAGSSDEPNDYRSSECYRWLYGDGEEAEAPKGNL